MTCGQVECLLGSDQTYFSNSAFLGCDGQGSHDTRKPIGLKQKQSPAICNEKNKKNGKLDTQQMPSVRTENTAMGREHRGACCHQHG